MRLGRSSRQSELQRTRRANHGKSSGNEFSNDVKATAVDQADAHSVTSADQSTSHHQQSFNQASSELHAEDMNALTHRQYKEVKGKARGHDKNKHNFAVPEHQSKVTERPHMTPDSHGQTIPTLPPYSNGTQHLAQPINSIPVLPPEPYPPPDAQLWVRIPYPLFSYTYPASGSTMPAPATQKSANGAEGQSPKTDSFEKFSYPYIASAGWFDSLATQMREMTVSTLDEASDALWEGSRVDKKPKPEEHL